MEKHLIKWLAENFDISRQESVESTFVYLHDVTTVSNGMFGNLAKFSSFEGIELRDGCITVIVRKDIIDIADICTEVKDRLKTEISAYEEGLICSIEFLNKVTDLACTAITKSAHSVCTNYHACTTDNKLCMCILGEVKI